MIDASITRIMALLNRVRKYSDIVGADSFEEPAMSEMKENVKTILKDVEAEVSNIEDEVDDW